MTDGCSPYITSEPPYNEILGTNSFVIFLRFHSLYRGFNDIGARTSVGVGNSRVLNSLYRGFHGNSFYRGLNGKSLCPSYTEFHSDMDSRIGCVPS